MLEARRHLPIVRATDLLARWAIKDPPAFKSWMPDYAIDHRGSVPEWVRQDLRVGVELRLASQGLYDAIQELSDA